MKASLDAQALQRLIEIGIALSAERNLSQLLEMIVDEARRLTSADGGTLYLVEGDSLAFHIAQTQSLGIRLGPASPEKVPWPPVPLYDENGEPNDKHVAAWVAHNGRLVNIPDVYHAEGFHFAGTRQFDAKTGYRSKSMLVLPLQDHEDRTLGVLQLVNAVEDGEVAPFAAEFEPALSALASQAAVAITNARLIQEMEHLFEAFVRVMSTAIDARSPSTAGHMRRVTELTMALAEAVHESDLPRFADCRFTEDDFAALRLAAWLHDVGKVTTPVHIMEKTTKLQDLYDGIELIRTRFTLIRQIETAKHHARRAELAANGASPEELAAEEARYQEAMAQLREDEEFVAACNIPQEFMPDEDIERLKQIAAKTYEIDGVSHPYLTEGELERLSVRRGNLTAKDLEIMRDHATMTIRILEQIPFTEKLKQVPEYAGGHHEKLNGTGYPRGLRAEQLPLQTRMMAIADVYEALTASDRSYKRARSQEEALRILRFMVKDGELDGDLVELFISSGVYKLCGSPEAALKQS